MDIQKIISVLKDLVYEDINNEEYWKAIKEAKALIKELKQALPIPDVVGQSEQLPCQHCGQLEPCAGNSPETCYHPKVC